MDGTEATGDDAQRLERLWAGEFGDDYTERNDDGAESRRYFWTELLASIDCTSVLEVGCNLGGNLQWIATVVDAAAVFGIDVNQTALRTLRSRHPDLNAVWSVASDLPFKDRRFDLVFSMGVLIHQPPDSIRLVTDEMLRCSSRYLFVAEYEDDDIVEVPYRGQRGALFRRPYGRLLQEWYPELRLVREGILQRDEGWDDHTWYLFERS